jgi:hypothetical protein
MKNKLSKSLIKVEVMVGVEEEAPTMLLKEEGEEDKAKNL